MQNDTQAITRHALLEKANVMIKAHDNYFTGMEATDVVQHGEVFVFSGPFFLDENEIPTAKTTAVFNVFKYLAVALSSQYHLE